jgi:predicted nucleotidyltransferase
LTESERKAVQTFVHKVGQRFPDRVRAILLFGSRARGDAGPDSDIDLLVVMDTPDLETRRAIRDLAVEVWLTDGIYLSTRVWSEADRRQHADLQTAFYENLQRDAIHVLAPPFASE